MAQTKKKSSSTTSTKSPTEQTRDISTGHKLSSTEVAAQTPKGEWPVPPGTKNPPNEKVGGKDVTKLDQGLDDLAVELFNGGQVVFRLGKEERLVDQAALHSAAKKIAKGIQVSY